MLTLVLKPCPSNSLSGEEYLTFADPQQRPLLMHLLCGETAFQKAHLFAIEILAEAHGWKIVVEDPQPPTIL